MRSSFTRIGLRLTFATMVLLAGTSGNASDVRAQGKVEGLPAETFGPLPGGKVGVVQGRTLHCLEVRQNAWRRCRSWPALSLPEDTQRVLGNERVISIVRADRIEFLDEEATPSRGKHLVLEPQWLPTLMTSGEYSTEREMVLLTSSQMLVRLPGDPDSNVTIPLNCPDAANARVFGLMGPGRWALTGADGLRSVALRRDKEGLVCVRQPSEDWQAPEGTDEVAVIGLDMLAVRTGSRIRFLVYDKGAHGWVQARQRSIGVPPGKDVPDLMLDQVISGPTPEVKSLEIEAEPDAAALQFLADSLVPERYAYARVESGKFILVQASENLVASEGRRLGVLDAKGEVLLPTNYAQLEYLRKSRRFKVGVGSGDALRWGYVSEKGVSVVPTIYDELRRISNSGGEPTALARLDGKWGYIDIVSGKVLVEPIYDRLMLDSLLIDGFGEGVLAAKQQGRWGVIDTDGKPIKDFIYDSVSSGSHGLVVQQGDEKRLLRIDGKEVVEELALLPDGRGHLVPSPPFGGIGVGLDFSKGQDLVSIVYVVPGSPADKAGLRTSDVVLAVGGRSLSRMTPEQTLEAIKGAAGTAVSLSVRREGRKMAIRMTRAVIKLP